MSIKLKIKPLGDQVVVKPLTEDKKTPSGIVIPDTVSKENPQKGITKNKTWRIVFPKVFLKLPIILLEFSNDNVGKDA